MNFKKQLVIRVIKISNFLVFLENQVHGVSSAVCYVSTTVFQWYLGTYGVINK